MDPDLYSAAVEGNLEVLMQQMHQFEAQVTPNNNTVLHVAALFNNNSTLVTKLLAAKPLLLRKVNTKDETSLHIAAREGHYDTVHALIKCAKELEGSELEIGIGMAKEMLRMVNKAGNTALHEAVRNNRINIVDLLVDEDYEFIHPVNDAEETPLYVAAERGFDHIVSKILNTCRSPLYSGPDGRTALHGAVTKNCAGCTTQLLLWKQSLIKESDIYGWTPLHYAARFGYLSMVKLLLSVDKSVTYLTANGDSKKTCLHIAASWGHTMVMKELISRCPDCWEMVDSKGQNILHFACNNQQRKAVNFILADPRLSSLINQTDEDGNAPLHLLAASGISTGHTRGLNYVRDMVQDPRVEKDAFNKDKLTPLDITLGDSVTEMVGFMKDKLKKAGARRSTRNVVTKDNAFIARSREARVEFAKTQPLDIRKMSGTHLIVAAFIATVTFAAGFTVPGGYVSNEGKNQGTAMLVKDAAFKAFVIFNTIAFMLSSCALFLHFIATFYDEPLEIITRSTTAYNFIFCSMVAMMVAFMTGMYAVLAPSIALAISVCSVVSLSFAFFFGLIGKLNHDYFT